MKAGTDLYDLGVKEWLFNQSVDDHEKRFNIKIKDTISKGYESRKTTIRSPKETCVNKIFAHCEKPEFINSLTEDEIKVYYLLKKSINV